MIAWKEKGMEPMYPKILPWLARKARVSDCTAEVIWLKAVRDADNDCFEHDSPEFWKSAVDHLLERIAVESLVRNAAPYGWGSLARLPATYWLYGLASADAMFVIGQKLIRNHQDHSYQSARPRSDRLSGSHLDRRNVSSIDKTAA
jgi:hypothetical protein